MKEEFKFSQKKDRLKDFKLKEFKSISRMAPKSTFQHYTLQTKCWFRFKKVEKKQI